MNQEKVLKDLFATRDILATSIEVYHEGQEAFYRTIAVQLRILLADKGNSLIPRLFPHFSLHPLRGDQKKIDEHTVFYMPSRLNFDGKGGVNVEELFDESKGTIFLDQWLDQRLFNLNITIRELIKSVADKEGAHSDPEYNSTLNLTKKVMVANTPSDSLHVVAIGEYVLRVLDKVIENRFAKLK